MSTRKILLNYLVDISGVATLNNFYFAKARTYKGVPVYIFLIFK